eukprot:1535064-Prymnesium_polylepis.1
MRTGCAVPRADSTIKQWRASADTMITQSSVNRRCSSVCVDGYGTSATSDESRVRTEIHEASPIETNDSNGSLI